MSSQPPTDYSTLTLSREEMRALGYRVIDRIVDHFTGLPAKPVTRGGSRQELEESLREPLPESSSPPEQVLDQLLSSVYARIMHVDHPRFFAFVPGPNNFIGAMADALVSGFNGFAGTWLAGSAMAQLELVTVDWLRDLCGLPEAAGGLFLSGGSMANVTALAVARHVKLDDRIGKATVYYSDQTHSSIERALRLLGFPADHLRKLPSDSSCRLSMDELSRHVRSDRQRGLEPFCVVANAGATNTGAVDPLPELADFCGENRLWLHADGAYGAAAVLCAQGREVLKGMDRADSLSLDPHKWLFQPFEIGCVLVRDARWLKQTFQIHPEYLRDVPRTDEAVNFCDYGIQLTRNFRALKLWMSLKVFGRAAFEQAIARGFALAEFAEGELKSLPGWRIVTPAQMGIVTFRYEPHSDSPGGNEINQKIAAMLVKDGFAMMSTTELRGETLLRLCTINPRTTEADIEQTIARLHHFATQF